MQGVMSENYFYNASSTSNDFEVFTHNSLVILSKPHTTPPSSLIENFKTPPNLCVNKSALSGLLDIKFFFLEHNSPIDSKSPYYSSLIENVQLNFNCNHLIPKTIHT